jgi:predicted ATPase
MHLRSLKITNFRAIKEIDVEFDNRVNVIVGPNAIGKTTILEAIRLAKGVLSPRTQNETNQVLFALGASSPHMPNRMNFSAIAQDVAKPIVISCVYKFSDSEIQWIKDGIDGLAHTLVQARMGQSFANPAVLISYMATAQGKQQLESASNEAVSELEKIIAAANQVKIELTINMSSGPASTGSQMSPFFISALESRLPPNTTHFSYFPADRSLPAGEQPVQLGAADTNQQMESHNSQPQLKYSRLKNTIFSAVVMSGDDRDKLYGEFGRIFSGVLKGRKIIGVGINEIGLLSIKIQDIESGRIFDMDGMSSGEKGLILTFLLIERSVVDGGMILLDEPELHLNPAVCKDLLPFIVDAYAARKNMQVILCSHSPEILAGAFDREECSLYHLISGQMLTKVRRQDQEIIASALAKLGTSESEGLLYKGTVFVEGPDDVTILETGFGDILRRYKVKDLGGRSEIEKLIETLQTADAIPAKISPRFFIFDKDDAPTSLASTDSVKVLQWDRRCLENYLLDIDAISDLLMDSEISKQKFDNAGSVTQFLKQLAFNQLAETAARDVFKRSEFGDVNLRLSDIKNKQLEEIASTLMARLTSMKQRLAGIDGPQWESSFVAACREHERQLRDVWEGTWREACDGKRLFQDIGAANILRMNVRNFKKRVMVQMRNTQTENWRSIKSLLSELISA